LQIKEKPVQVFLEKSLKDNSYKVLPLAGDASTRKYYRVILDNSSWVLMVWNPFDPDHYPFTSVLSHFENNKVHVPKIISMSPQDGLVLLEDLGDLTLERKFWEEQNPENSFIYYKLAIDEIVKVHFHSTLNKKPCTAFDIEFNVEKFVWEMNYGKDNLIKGILNYSFSEKVEKEIQQIFTKISTHLHLQPKFISHRDYHSRNLMIKLDKMFVIDFQDARLGPVQYDLVSLIKDSYVDINEDFGDKIISYYLEQAKPFLSNFSMEEFNHIYELQSIQRCFKACGSFASFFHQRQDRRYLKYLNGTLKKVIKSLTAFPEYKAFSDVLIDSGVLEKKFELI
jgi:aminoglycoside/choline kinase family phosphotransferase